MSDVVERRTSEVAAMLGISTDLIRKWKKRGHLSLAPAGVAGQGRSVECFWSEAAIQQVRDRLKSRADVDAEITALRAQLASAIKERDDLIVELGDMRGWESPAAKLRAVLDAAEDNEKAAEARALAATAESDRLRRALEAATKLADGYGIVLAMISAGADAPQKFAKRMLAEYASEAEAVRNFK